MKVKDQDIVALIRKQPEQGFRLLLASYERPIYWHIRRIVVLHDDAQDATQETFVRVFRSLEQYSGKSSFSAWLYKIATNEALRLLNRRKSEESSIDEAAPDIAQLTADEYIDYSDLEAVRLQEAIRSLPTKQQIAFNLRYYDELSYEEIAEVAGSSAAAAKVNYHIAKEKIIAYFHTNE